MALVPGLQSQCRYPVPVPLDMGSNGSLLLLIPGWPQHPLFGFYHLYNQFSASNSFSFTFLSSFCFARSAAFMGVLLHERLCLQRLTTQTYEEVPAPLHDVQSFSWTHPCLLLCFISPDIPVYTRASSAKLLPIPAIRQPFCRLCPPCPEVGSLSVPPTTCAHFWCWSSTHVTLQLYSFQQFTQQPLGGQKLDLFHPLLNP